MFTVEVRHSDGSEFTFDAVVKFNVEPDILTMKDSDGKSHYVVLRNVQHFSIEKEGAEGSS